MKQIENHQEDETVISDDMSIYYVEVKKKCTWMTGVPSSDDGPIPFICNAPFKKDCECGEKKDGTSIPLSEWQIVIQANFGVTPQNYNQVFFILNNINISNYPEIISLING